MKWKEWRRSGAPSFSQWGIFGCIWSCAATELLPSSIQAINIYEYWCGQDDGLLRRHFLNLCVFSWISLHFQQACMHVCVRLCVHMFRQHGRHPSKIPNNLCMNIKAYKCWAAAHFCVTGNFSLCPSTSAVCEFSVQHAITHVFVCVQQLCVFVLD